jgi:hypothetical protein
MALTSRSNINTDRNFGYTKEIRVPYKFTNDGYKENSCINNNNIIYSQTVRTPTQTAIYIDYREIALESHAGSSPVAARATHSGQGWSEVPDKHKYPDPPC